MSSVSFLWPGFLYALAVMPALVGFYIWVLHRRKRFAVRYSSLALLRGVLPSHSWIRRHLPFILFFATLASLILALSRPVSVVPVPTSQTTIVLAIDVSRSMCSSDIPPNRLEAAKAAALSFIRDQSASTQIGIVAFSGFAELIQPPTADRAALAAAINSLLTGRRTAIGSGILKSIDAIAEVDENVAPTTFEALSQDQATPVPKGAYVPDIIVLLTDGASNTGPLPLDAAQEAADRGIRVYAIGFGTEQGGEFANCFPQDLGNEPLMFGGGIFGGGGMFRRGIDEDTLKQVAALSGAEYYSAESAGQLNEVFHKLPTYLITKHQTIELTVMFAMAAAVLTALAMLLALAWHPVR